MNSLPIHDFQAATMPALRAGCLVVALSCCNTGSAAGPKPQNQLEQIFYDMGVIGYCGLSSDTASSGFRQQLAELVAREKFEPLQVRDARNRALSMVEWEWDNRGLGGFRGWCSSEGEAAVKRFSN